MPNEEYQKITLVDETHSVECLLIATVSLEGGEYAIVHPLDEPGVDEDEAFVFQVFPGEGEQGDSYNFIKDEDIIRAVFNEYYKMIGETPEE